MILLIFVAFITFLLFHQFWLRRKNLPDGPMPLPIIGNVHQYVFKQTWTDKFLEWKEKYGPVYTLWNGFIPVVTVNDYETCVKLFVNEADAFSDRPKFQELNTQTRGGLYGVTFLSGPMWQEQRRASLKILREFGMGKNQMQDRILEEVQAICDGLNKRIEDGLKEQNVYELTDIAVGSVVNSLLCGFSYTTNNKQSEFYEMKRQLDEATREFFDPINNAIIQYDVLMNLPILNKRIAKLKAPFVTILKYLTGIIEEHKRRNDYSDPTLQPQDYIDAYQLEMRKAHKTGNGQFYSEEQCCNLILDLWTAGQGTTSATMQWAIAFLIRHPKVQEKVKEELEQVVGNDRLVNVGDRSKLPYVNATILEIQRCANLLTFNLPHALARDVVLNGQKIKKGTTVFPQISVIMTDPKNFPNPKEFKPERFIDSKGQLINDEKVMPFSLDKRICIGEGLARMEIFLMISNMVNQFKFLPGATPPSLKRRHNGGSPETELYTCRVEKRF